MQTTYDEKQVTMDIIIEDLEYLGDFLTIEEMAQNIKCYNEQDIKKLISDNKLPAAKKNGKHKVRLEDYAEWYASVMDLIPKNGDDPDFYDGTNIFI
jgi:hypothetical protein